MVALYDDQLSTGPALPAVTEDGDGGQGGSGLTVESMRTLMVLIVMAVMKIGMMVLLAPVMTDAGNGEAAGLWK